MIQTKIFKNNQTQAVRLPKAVALPDTVREVTVVAVGQSRVITPADQSWDVWFEQAAVTGDFMADREQSVPQERESF